MSTCNKTDMYVIYYVNVSKLSMITYKCNQKIKLLQCYFLCMFESKYNDYVL